MLFDHFSLSAANVGRVIEMKYGHVESTYQHERGAVSRLVKLSHEKPPGPVLAQIFSGVDELFVHILYDG